MDNETLINSYFEGSLTESQQEDFDRLLMSDPAFAADFEFQQELQGSLKKNERQQIKNMLFNLNEATEKPKTKVISMRPWLVAASAVFLIGISAWLFFFTNTSLDSGQLYDVNFVPYENVVHPIERGEQLEDLKTKAFTAYEDENYRLALELFKELQQKHADSYIDFYKGIVLMQLNKPEEAIPVLESYIASNGELKDRATWYLALAYLKIGDYAKSKIELEKLIQMDSFKTKAAEELLKALG